MQYIWIHVASYISSAHFCTLSMMIIHIIHIVYVVSHIASQHSIIMVDQYVVSHRVSIHWQTNMLPVTTSAFTGRPICYQSPCQHSLADQYVVSHCVSIHWQTNMLSVTMSAFTGRPICDHMLSVTVSAFNGRPVCCQSHCKCQQSVVDPSFTQGVFPQWRPP